MVMATQEQCQVLDQTQVGPRYFKLTIKSLYIATNAEPGQFVNVRVDNGTEPLLRRPISLHKINREHQTFELLYEVLGQGTELLSKVTVGAKLDILGPLGSGFKLDPEKKIAILVGGGMGVAPLLSLAQQLKLLGGRAVYALAGARDKSCLLCETDFAELANEKVIATDDGSSGRKGYVSDLLLDLLNNTLETRHYPETAIYACGPKGMLKAVAEIALQRQIDCQVSMEEKMACGIGACLGCAVATRNGYKMVCKDGPVFNAKEIVW